MVLEAALSHSEHTSEEVERMKAPLGRVLEGDSNIWKAPKLYLLKQIYKERGGL